MISVLFLIDSNCIDKKTVRTPSLSLKNKVNVTKVLTQIYNNFEYLQSDFLWGNFQVNCLIPVTQKATINLVLKVGNFSTTAVLQILKSIDLIRQLSLHCK